MGTYQYKIIFSLHSHEYNITGDSYEGASKSHWNSNKMIYILTLHPFGKLKICVWKLNQCKFGNAYLKSPACGARLN